MNTPIVDFVNRYTSQCTLRLHMPGHKGIGTPNVEMRDITEIAGADSLYEACGIIAESERNASGLFGCPTYYSTEGSSQAIRAMVYLAVLHAKAHGRTPCIAAGRNAHKTFLSAAALMDVPVQWMYPCSAEGYLSCRLQAQDIDALADTVTAVYVTSPDYTGHILDISSLSAACHRRGILLLVDNAHGAYLKFLRLSCHPMDLGADLCCDSAHKTLPVLTGGAYLHTSPAFDPLEVKHALMLFGSTSPSYLILQSLDAVNDRLANGLIQDIRCTAQKAEELQTELTAHGFHFLGEEPLKWTLDTKALGYTGDSLATWLRQNGVEPEFADPDQVVLMISPALSEQTLVQITTLLRGIQKGAPLLDAPPPIPKPTVVTSPRKALLSPAERLPVERCVGRVLASAEAGCPPAVPIVVSGERIDQTALDCFRYYGIRDCRVIKE